MRFLRKGIPKRYKRRVPIENKKRPHLPIGVFLLWLLFFATLFYVSFFSVFFLIGEPQIVGVSEITEESLRGFVERQLDGKNFNIFLKRNFFLMQSLALEKNLFKEYPLLSSVTVTRVFPNGLHIAVVERKKIILWCVSEPVSDATEAIFSDGPASPPTSPSLGGQCFLIDEKGIAHDGERALLPENKDYVLFITDMSGKKVVAGEKVFDPDYGKFVVQLNDLFQEQLEISLEPRFTIISRFANEVRVKTSEGWDVYFGTDVPLQSSLNALKLLFDKELPKEKRAKLAYIDLRTENRAYYTLRAEEKSMENKDAVASPVPEEKKVDEQKNKKKK